MITYCSKCSPTGYHNDEPCCDPTFECDFCAEVIPKEDAQSLHLEAEGEHTCIECLRADDLNRTDVVSVDDEIIADRYPVFDDRNEDRLVLAVTDGRTEPTHVLEVNGPWIALN